MTRIIIQRNSGKVSSSRGNQEHNHGLQNTIANAYSSIDTMQSDSCHGSQEDSDFLLGEAPDDRSVSVSVDKNEPLQDQESAYKPDHPHSQKNDESEAPAQASDSDVLVGDALNSALPSQFQDAEPTVNVNPALCPVPRVAPEDPSNSSRSSTAYAIEKPYVSAMPYTKPRRKQTSPPKTSPPESKPESPRYQGHPDGYNSEDEYASARPSGSRDFVEREAAFELEIFRLKNLKVRRMLDDGNCLFRAVADQVYGDADMCHDARQMCIDYMEKDRDHFSQFVTEHFSAYCKRKRRDKVHGNNLEIQAMAEMYNRPIHIYSYSTEPINIFHGNYHSDVPPILLSYHRGNHYNSLIDPGRPNGLNGKEQVKAALKAQQDQQVEKALIAHGMMTSELDLTEKQLERQALEASIKDYIQQQSFFKPPSATVQGSSSTSTNHRTHTSGSSTAVLGDFHGGGGKEESTNNARMLMSMGFGYLQVMQAVNLFNDDFDSMLCFLLEGGAMIQGN